VLPDSVHDCCRSSVRRLRCSQWNPTCNERAALTRGLSYLLRLVGFGVITMATWGVVAAPGRTSRKATSAHIVNGKRSESFQRSYLAHYVLVSNKWRSRHLKKLSPQYDLFTTTGCHYRYAYMQAMDHRKGRNTWRLQVQHREHVRVRGNDKGDAPSCAGPARANGADRSERGNQAGACRRQSRAHNP
jgi:hypothetical protein